MIPSGLYVEMYVNQTLGASSCYSGYPHTNMVKGNNGTWCSLNSLAGQGWKEYIDVAFPASVKLEKVDVIIPQGYKMGRYVSSISKIDMLSTRRKMKEIYSAKNPTDHPFTTQQMNQTGNVELNFQNAWGTTVNHQCFASIPIKKKVVCQALRIYISEMPGQSQHWIEVQTVKIYGKLTKAVKRNDEFIISSNKSTSSQFPISEEDNKKYHISRNITPENIEKLKKKGNFESFIHVILSSILRMSSDRVLKDSTQEYDRLFSEFTTKDYECLLFVIFQKPRFIASRNLCRSLLPCFSVFHGLHNMKKYENLVCLHIKNGVIDLEKRKNVELICHLFIDCFRRYEAVILKNDVKKEEEEEEEVAIFSEYEDTESRVLKTRFCSVILHLIENHEKRNSIRLYLRSLSKKGGKRRLRELDECLDILVPNNEFIEDLEEEEEEELFPNIKDLEEKLFDDVSEMVFEQLSHLGEERKKKKEKNEEEDEGVNNSRIMGLFQSKFDQLIHEIKQVKDENKEIKEELKNVKREIEVFRNK